MSLKNKKIVFLLTNDFTHDSRVFKEAFSAKKAGMKVVVLGRKSKNTKFHEEINGIKIIRVQSLIDRIWARISKTGGSETGGSQSTGQSKFLINLVMPINLYLINRHFTREVKRIKPHLIHANDSDTLMAALTLKQEGYKIIYDAHELYMETIVMRPWWTKRIFSRLEKNLKDVDAIFSVCQSILDILNEKYGLNHLPQAVLYNAPLYQKSSLSGAKRQIKIIYIGGKSQSRETKYLFSAFKKVKNASLTLIGPGWGKSKRGNIETLPPVEIEKVVDIAVSYDIGIIPYIGHNLNQNYSLPNKLFEYMMAGLAIAASNLPEVKKIIKEADNGILFNPRDTKDITAKLNSLIKNKEILQKYQKNSLKYAKKYSWENQEQKQLNIYEKILKK